MKAEYEIIRSLYHAQDRGELPPCNLMENLDVIHSLIRSSRRLRKLYEYECNGCTREKFPGESWESYDMARTEQMKYVDEAQERAQKRAMKLAEKLGLPIYFQGDPRGPSIYVGTKDDKDKGRGVALY